MARIFKKGIDQAIDRHADLIKISDGFIVPNQRNHENLKNEATQPTRIRIQTRTELRGNPPQYAQNSGPLRNGTFHDKFQSQGICRAGKRGIITPRIELRTIGKTNLSDQKQSKFLIDRKIKIRNQTHHRNQKTVRNVKKLPDENEIKNRKYTDNHLHFTLPGDCLYHKNTLKMTTKQIFEAHNKKLKEKLIPSPGEPIECNHATDKNDENYFKPLKK